MGLRHVELVSYPLKVHSALHSAFTLKYFMFCVFCKVTFGFQEDIAVYTEGNRLLVNRIN